MPRYLSSGSALLSVAWIALSSSMTEEVTAARMAAVVERVACEKARIAIKEANSAYGARMAAEVAAILEGIQLVPTCPNPKAEAADAIHHAEERAPWLAEIRLPSIGFPQQGLT